ncbi:chromate resistance protein [Candidatus Acetothermia bacterium]|nr:chromate resistance protein [Candidatus Acetothermia bacterium]MBI3642569.1 chromate resistance protein [Candidatus Acetothermia bacterium]
MSIEWVVFTYSLPSKLRSSPRVALWRRLKRLGSISLAGGTQILPARDECVEAFQWLAQEIRHAKGEALVMRVQQFEGLTDLEMIEHFRRACLDEYGELESEIAELEKGIRSKNRSADLSIMREMLVKLRRRFSEITHVDYFDSTEGTRLAARLARIEENLSPAEPQGANVPAALIAEYRDKRWVTRPHPHVDRLACAWLIRRFINPDAVIRYAAKPEPDEIAFDMDGAQFEHRGNLCTFETMLLAFSLEDPAFRSIAEIVHEIDLRDGRYLRTETAGIDLILNGWLLTGLSDAEIERNGISLFEGLYGGGTQRAAKKSRSKKLRKKQD